MKHRFNIQQDCRMFIFHKETTLEDLGNGVTRRILAMMAK
ncbi:Uncharacterised protein [Kluyvera cryocrescens]|uniref:Uncharacterized protein n=1 Tax=Kluyvera cryocrescens TaxID=580 RepID=A0A485AT42_KLUCR|nr:Uncharacterised protein [Kluyvera cryocrescens]